MQGRLIWTPGLAIGFAFALSTNIAAQEPPTSSWAANAQVKFWIEPLATSGPSWYPERIEEHTGIVVSFDDKQFVAKLSGRESDYSVSAQRVVWIEPIDAPRDEQAAIDQFSRGEYDACLRPLLDAVASRPPVWRQQWLSIVASQAAMRSGRYKVALELVNQIDSRPLPPMCIGWMPVVWQSKLNDKTMQEAAIGKLADSTPATRLVAASWLLSSPTRSQAVAVLQSLERDVNREEIASLARALLWQIVPPPEVGTQIDAWREQLDAMPMTLQTGPMLTLFGKLNASGRGDQAKPLQLSLELTPIYPHPEVNPRSNPHE
jgi:hypothetical protein